MHETKFRLDNRTIIVTGSASGMGRAVAEAVCAAGGDAVLVDRDSDALEEVAKRIKDRGHSCTSVAIDLTDEDAPTSVVAASLEAFGSIHVLVHTAGVFDQAPLGECSRQSLDRQLAVNAVAPFMLSQAALPHLGPGGSIIFVSSIGAHVGWADCSAYSLTKGGIEALSRALAVELAPKGIRVNTIAPGTTDTPMNDEMFAIPGMKEQIIAKIPLGRIAAADDIAFPAVFLASDAARHIVGQTVIVDGGYVAQ